MPNVYDIIEKEFPEKKEELIKDFEEWLRGDRALPRTKEIRAIITRKYGTNP